MSVSFRDSVTCKFRVRNRFEYFGHVVHVAVGRRGIFLQSRILVCKALAAQKKEMIIKNINKTNKTKFALFEKDLELVRIERPFDIGNTLRSQNK